MSKTATIRVIGRDMDEKMLHIREETCVWTLDEEETAEQQALKAIPDYLWKVADYIDSVGKWQGTAAELLVAANIFDVKPNQFTRKMAHYARDVFSPRGIEYKYTCTEQKRLFEFFHDDDDDDDDDVAKDLIELIVNKPVIRIGQNEEAKVNVVVVEKYHGECQMKSGDGIFVVKVILPFVANNDRLSQ